MRMTLNGAALAQQYSDTGGYSRREPDLPASLLMTVENTSIVDAAGTDTETGEVRLSIFLGTQSTSLFCKTKSTCTLASSSQANLSYPNAKGRPLVIDLFTKFRPTEDAARLLKQAEAVSENYGVSLRQAPSMGGYADDSA
ncbi:hypothetical protein J7E49_08975 [Variovorax paradoxus]|nr:hypothetical protein [Variovorax paradoxus]